MPYYTRTTQSSDGTWTGIAEDITGEKWVSTRNSSEEEALSSANEVALNWNKRDFSLLCEILGQPDPYLTL